MSAPRKIWMTRRCADLVDYKLRDDEHIYHHDDVVRELVEALGDMVAVAEQDGWDKAMTGRQMIIRNARAALAKIAQEGS